MLLKAARGEVPAPLKLNEVFISRADSALNSHRSRAVTVHVSLSPMLLSLSVCLALPVDRKKLKWDFFLSPPLPPFFFFLHLLYSLPQVLSLSFSLHNPFSLLFSPGGDCLQLCRPSCSLSHRRGESVTECVRRQAGERSETARHWKVLE